MHYRSTLPAFALYLLFALLLAGCVTKKEESPVSATRRQTSQEITAQDFGMHVIRPQQVGWPPVPIGFWRMWDSGVQWPALEPERGEWDFSLLDSYIDLAESRGVQPVIVLGLTPRWASTQPNISCNYGLGTCAEPTDLADWENYVTTVATRYRGRVRYYELWNEPNLPNYYTGTLPGMVALSRSAYNVLKEVDSRITVLSPAAVIRISGVDWLRDYLAAGGGQYADVIAYHFYQFPAAPEVLTEYFNAISDVLANAGINRPVWDTEMGWGPTQVFTSDQQMADYVGRAMLLHWDAGINRVAWFAWDERHWSRLLFTYSDNITPTPAAAAFSQMQSWGIGSTSVICSATSDNTRTCELQQGEGVSRYAVWNPDRTTNFAIPSQWRVTTYEQLLGASGPLTSGQISVGSTPVLLKP